MSEKKIGGKELVQQDLFGKKVIDTFDDGINEEETSKYTAKIDVPHYKIKGKKPRIDDLYDDGKTLNLQKKIRRANIKDKELEYFLNLCCYRFLEFNYSNIAEYYANADKKTQELMEELVLVIIDFDNAVSKGYVQYTQKMKNIIQKYYGDEFNEIR